MHKYKKKSPNIHAISYHSMIGIICPNNRIVYPHYYILQHCVLKCLHIYLQFNEKIKVLLHVRMTKGRKYCIQSNTGPLGVKQCVVVG